MEYRLFGGVTDLGTQKLFGLSQKNVIGGSIFTKI